MISWAEKIAFVGITARRENKPRYSRYRVRLSYNPGLCSFGDGDTLDEATERAAIGLPICWSSVERKITEREWRKMAHT